MGGGQSRDIFRGGPVKKTTLYFLRVEEAVDVVAVYLQIHPECKLASASGLKMMSGENLLRR